MQGYHQQPQFAQRTSPRGDLHEGLQRFMTGVYGWMAAGLAVTAAMVMLIATNISAIRLLYGPTGPTGLYYVALAVPLIMAFVLPAKIPSMSRGMAVALFMLYAAAIGVMISYVPLVYTGASILGALGGTVGIFAGMAAIGLVTKRDLSGMGQFFAMVLMGAVIASLINLFLHSSGLSYAISIVVVVVSAGLTAYYNQMLRQVYKMHGGAGNLAINGALALYVNFINMFLSLLRLFGSSRD